MRPTPTLRASWPPSRAVALGCIALVLGIVCGLCFPFAWSSYAESGQFGDAFKLGKIFDDAQGQPWPDLADAPGRAAAGLMVAGSVGSALCGIGVAFTGFYAQLVTAFLYGKLYRQAAGQDPIAARMTSASDCQGQHRPWLSGHALDLEPIQPGAI